MLNYQRVIEDGGNVITIEDTNVLLCCNSMNVILGFRNLCEWNLDIFRVSSTFDLCVFVNM